MDRGKAARRPLLRKKRAITDTLHGVNHEAYFDDDGSKVARARSRASRPTKRRITPDDRKLEVRILLAALETGESIRAAAKMAGLSERRVVRWVAFNGFGPMVQKSQRKGRRTKAHPFGEENLNASIELTIAINDRTWQQTADRYAGGDREQLYEMWMSRALDKIYEREAIADLRGHGKHALADHYEIVLANEGPRRRRDYVGDEMRRAGFPWRVDKG